MSTKAEMSTKDRDEFLALEAEAEGISVGSGRSGAGKFVSTRQRLKAPVAEAPAETKPLRSEAPVAKRGGRERGIQHVSGLESAGPYLLHKKRSVMMPLPAHFSADEVAALLAEVTRVNALISNTVRFEVTTTKSGSAKSRQKAENRKRRKFPKGKSLK